MSSLSEIRGSRMIFTWVNCAAYAQDPEGDFGDLYLSPGARDAALARFRAAAVRRGLGESAARSGIYPVSMTVSDFLRDRRNRDTTREAFTVEGA